MIDRILPSSAVAAAELFADVEEPLLGVERVVVERAVDRRRREFASGRACARRALVRLGREPVAIGTGERGEPLWPAGVVGSITHCDGYRGCAVADVRDVVAIGIDAEPNLPLPDGILPQIASLGEAAHVAELERRRPDVHWGRLLFSAKESIYKAWFPATRSRVDYADAAIAFAPDAGTFAASVNAAAGDPADAEVIAGRWTAVRGLLATSVVLEAAPRSVP